MSIEMVRIDDRLIHGQIVAAWVKTLGIGRVWIVDDGVANDEFLKGVMAMVAPPNVKLLITDTSSINGLCQKFDNQDRKTMILVKYPKVAQKIFQTGIKHRALNVGGMGANADREQLFRNISASKEEKQTLKEIQDSGVEVYFQVTPDEKKTPFES